MRRDRRLAIGAVAVVMLFLFFRSGGQEKDSALSSKSGGLPRGRPSSVTAADIETQKTAKQNLVVSPAAPPPPPPATAARATAGKEFLIEFRTTKGNITFKAHRDWAPLGVAQLHKMVTSGFFDGDGPEEIKKGPPDGGIGIFRCVPKFVVQFGIHGDPTKSKQWGIHAIRDDEVKHSNKKGTLTFASAGKNTRTTQLFINLQDNAFLDKMGFATLAECVDNCDVIDKFEMKYGEKPNQGLIQQRGNAYLRESFPDLDFFTGASIL